MARVVVSVMTLGLAGLFCWDARSQVPDAAPRGVAPAPTASRAPVTPPPAVPTPAPETVAVPQCPANDDAAFEAEVRRYARLRAFTDKLQAAHEREAIDAAARVEEALELQAEREFDATLTSYLRKQAFTRALVERRVKPEPRK